MITPIGGVESRKTVGIDRDVEFHLLFHAQGGQTSWTSQYWSMYFRRQPRRRHSDVAFNNKLQVHFIDMIKSVLFFIP